MRQAGQALGFMEELLEEGEDALRILGTLHRSLRQVRGALGLQAARATREQMLAALRLNGPFAFKLNGLLDAAGSWSDLELGRALAALERADGRLKSGSEPRSTLASAVMTACGDEKGRVRSAGRTGR